MNNPLITIVMPVYNAEKYLAEAINSILNQTYKNFIFLIINDGSTDNGPQIMREFNDKRIVLLENEKNSGLIFSLNRGLDFATTKYIARMDADDISHPNRLEKQLLFMENNSDIGICGSYVRYFGNNFDGDVFTPATIPSDIKAELLFTSPYSHPSVIIRKELIDKFNLRYNPDFKNIEDFEFFQNASHLFKMSNIPEYLLDYRKVESSISTTVSKNTNINIENHIKVYKAGLIHFGLNPTIEELEIHKDLIFNPNKKSISELQKAEKWLKHLIEQNRKVNSYDLNSFSLVVSQYWDRVCIRSANLGINGFIIYLKSDLYQLSNINYINVLKYFIKSIIGKK